MQHRVWRHPPLHLSLPCSKAPPLFSFASVAIGAGLGGKKQREEEDELFLPVSTFNGFLLLFSWLCLCACESERTSSSRPVST